MKTRPHHGGRPKIISNPVLLTDRHYSICCVESVLVVLPTAKNNRKQVQTYLIFTMAKRTIGQKMRNKREKPETTIYILLRYSYNFFVHNFHYLIVHNLYNMPYYLVYIFIIFVRNILNMISKNKNIWSINKFGQFQMDDNSIWKR